MNLSEIRVAKQGDELVDDDVRGLQLRVQKRRKTFLLYYRTKSGQRRRPKLGDFPSMTLRRGRRAGRCSPSSGSAAIPHGIGRPRGRPKL